eukprot:TRINITY_DN1298_c2_g1_i2.p1 TRINITY_DN1298_c2_g1~~TRINITY_DN1298_c2_g1_i2.p1  ORF type:complete len:198 (+),score=50.02 TRINITY_DN1298_c2_g1_i2:185-778(+)
MEEKVLILKVRWNDTELQKITVPTCISFSQLYSMLFKMYDGTHFAITYVDDELDKITITNEEELREAVRLASQQQTNFLRIQLEAKKYYTDDMKAAKHMHKCPGCKIHGKEVEGDDSELTPEVSTYDIDEDSDVNQDRSLGLDEEPTQEQMSFEQALFAEVSQLYSEFAVETVGHYHRLSHGFVGMYFGLCSIVNSL